MDRRHLSLSVSEEWKVCVTIYDLGFLTASVSCYVECYDVRNALHFEASMYFHIFLLCLGTQDISWMSWLALFFECPLKDIFFAYIYVYHHVQQGTPCISLHTMRDKKTNSYISLIVSPCFPTSLKLLYTH